MKILIDKNIPYIHGHAERIGEAIYLSPDEFTPEAVRDADALIIRTRTRVDAALLAGSRVRFVATATIGFDHLDTVWLEAQGIGWTNCPGCNAASVAQYVQHAVSHLEEDGTLSPESDVAGVVGVGHVGTLVARMLRRRGYRVLLCDPYQQTLAAEDFEYVPYEDLLHAATVFTFHVPLTPETFHMLNERHFRAGCLKKSVILNTSRGAVVSNRALTSALQQGLVRAAVLDVWEDEPEITLELLSLCRIATPHVAGYSADGKACATRMALTATARALGRPDLNFSSILPPALPAAYRYHHPLDPSPQALCPLASYNILSDDRALRAYPHLFERLRSQYPLRREEDAV